MMGAMLLEDAERRVERQPLGNARGQFAFALQFFEGEEIFPIGIILDGGDAGLGSIGQCQLERVAALRGSWFGQFIENYVLGSCAQDAGRDASGAAIDLTASRIGSGATYPGEFQRV